MKSRLAQVALLAVFARALSVGVVLLFAAVMPGAAVAADAGQNPPSLMVHSQSRAQALGQQSLASVQVQDRHQLRCKTEADWYAENCVAVDPAAASPQISTADYGHGVYGEFDGVTNRDHFMGSHANSSTEGRAIHRNTGC